jgi:hypothetical protein
MINTQMTGLSDFLTPINYFLLFALIIGGFMVKVIGIGD